MSLFTLESSSPGENAVEVLGWPVAHGCEGPEDKEEKTYLGYRGSRVGQYLEYWSWLHYIAILLSIENFLDEMSTYINIQSTGSWSTFLRKKKDTSGVWTPTYSFVYWEKEKPFSEEKKEKLQSVVGFEPTQTVKKKRKRKPRVVFEPAQLLKKKKMRATSGVWTRTQ